ncbi:MAG TPA: PKD domain-containing protein, partial [Verrucomicrobiae bacterium]|nr:PKD domain-containing protein [Verrucomicrobiae bacterium]
VTGSVTNVMNSSIELGMAVNALAPSVLNLSLFDNVSLVFSNGQPLYVTASAAAFTPTATQAPFLFTAQAYAGLIAQATTISNVDTTDDHTGTITAQGQNTSTGEVAVNAFDNSTATKWLDFATNNPATRASWIQYQYTNGAQRVVTEYTVTSANDSPERDPSNWRLLGSNDGGNTWTTLDTRNGENFPQRFEKLTYEIANPGGFNIYRFQIDSVANPALANSVQLSELEFIGGAVNTYTWSFGDGGTSTQQNPVHNYLANGTYNVTVVAYDGVSTATNTITVPAVLSGTVVPQWLPSTVGMANHKFHINIAGTDGLSYVIDATTNMKTWTPVFTNMTSGGLLMFTDTVTTNLPFRFYRAHTP